MRELSLFTDEVIEIIHYDLGRTLLIAYKIDPNANKPGIIIIHPSISWKTKNKLWKSYTKIFLAKSAKFCYYVDKIVYYAPRRTMRVIAWRATILAGDRSRGAISPANIFASLIISRIVCIGTYSILCDFGTDTSF